MDGTCNAYDVVSDASSFSYWDLTESENICSSDRPRYLNLVLLTAVRMGKLEVVRKIVSDVGEDCFKTFVDSYRLVEKAVEYKRVCMLKLIVALGGVVNKATDSPSPLHLACKNGDLCSAICLIQAGADVNRRDKNGCFPIHYAVQSNSIEKELTKYGRCHTVNYYRYISSHLTLLLIDSGASYLNCLDHSKLSPLHHAVLAGNTNAVSILLEHNADFDFKGSHGRTPLWCAVYSGNLELAEMLLEAGAKLDCIDEVGLTLLHVSVRRNDSDMTWFLLNLMRRTQMLGKIINQLSSEGESCLHYAAASLNKEIMGALIRFGASINQYNFDCSTPLISACSGHNPIEYLPPIQYTRRPHWSVNPILPSYNLSEADSHSCDYCSSIRYLIENGASVNECNKREEAPLHIAANRNLLCVVKLLLDNGAVIDAQDNDGLTPLHLSVAHHSLEMMSLLLERGADPDAKGEEYLTPLHLAAIRAEDSNEKTLQLISLLIEFNADINAKNIVDLTPLYLALRNALDGQFCATVNSRIIYLFLLNGADVFAMSSFNRSPLSVSVSHIYSDGEEPSGPLKHILNLICQTGIKMVAASPDLVRHTNTETTKAVTELMERHSYYPECLDEVALLKKTYILPNMPLFDLLSLSLDKFTCRLRNKDFEDALNATLCLSTFPAYGPLIRSKFLKAKKRKEDLEAGEQFFLCLSDYSNFPRLPLICLDLILKHLRVSDFRNIKRIVGNSPDPKDYLFNHLPT